MPKRISPVACCGVLIDVQTFFLGLLDHAVRTRIERQTAGFVRLLEYFQIPLTVTLERAVDAKGALPPSIDAHVAAYPLAATFQKDFFDLTREPGLPDHLRALGKTQMIVAGCETDVCVLQSCLGLLGLGFEVYVVEDLLFSSTPEVSSAIRRMRDEGAVFLTFKTLFYELFEAVEESPHRVAVTQSLGAFPWSILEGTI